MSVQSESAEQFMRAIIEGEQVCLKVTGQAAKELVVFLTAVLKNKSQTKGKTRLNSMLRSGKELKVFSVKKEDLTKFTSEAKKYGVLYSALISKKNKNYDNMVDIMVRAEDASKINRIVERYDIATLGEAQIRTDLSGKLNPLNERQKKKDIQLENSSKPLNKLEDNVKRESVRKKLEEIKFELSKTNNVQKEKIKHKDRTK